MSLHTGQQQQPATSSSLDIRKLVQEHIYVREVLDVEAEMGRVEELHSLSFPLEYPMEFYTELREAVRYQQQARRETFPLQSTPTSSKGDNNAGKQQQDGSVMEEIVPAAVTPTKIARPSKNWMVLVACLPVWVVKRVHREVANEKRMASASTPASANNMKRVRDDDDDRAVKEGNSPFIRTAPRPLRTLRPTNTASTTPSLLPSSSGVPPLTTVFGGNDGGDDDAVVHVDGNTFMMEATPTQERYLCTNYPPITDRCITTTTHTSSSTTEGVGGQRRRVLIGSSDDNDEEEYDDGTSYIVGVITGADKRVPLQHNPATLRNMSWVGGIIASMLSGSIPTPIGYVSTLGVDPLLRRGGIAGVLVDAFTQAASLRLSNMITANPICIVPRGDVYITSTTLTTTALSSCELTTTSTSGTSSTRLESLTPIPHLVGWRSSLGTSTKRICAPRPWYEEKGPWETALTWVCDAVEYTENVLWRRKGPIGGVGDDDDVRGATNNNNSSITTTGGGGGGDVQIWLHVLSSNTGAIRMYLRKGFKQHHRLEQFYNFCGRDHDALILSWQASSSLSTAATVSTPPRQGGGDQKASLSSTTSTPTKKRSWASTLRILLGGSSLVDLEALEPYQFSDTNYYSWVSVGALLGIVAAVLMLGSSFMFMIKHFKDQNAAYAAAKEAAKYR